MRTQDEYRASLAHLREEVAKNKQNMLGLALQAVQEDWDEQRLRHSHKPYAEKISELKLKIFRLTEAFLNFQP